MGRWRCCGCGLETKSRRRMKFHSVACLDVAALVQSNPGRIRAPDAEAAWWEEGLSAVYQHTADLERKYKELLIQEGMGNDYRTNTAYTE